MNYLMCKNNFNFFQKYKIVCNDKSKKISNNDRFLTFLQSI